ncbi:MAG: hypothetical protein COV59_04440 [Candidatus Magasanikbacteria bacterium CG11_big_fil_rev_8_21_14_0_20_39_34]|uniref:Uncharacterized protein n=1 Tax=Candidatus Magasanikbacteria bacterium CG11_big_fil_rev_8_21_14_0_20_39_34 TaxID=1974653 RepID=A0A2H0N483_9BACT|nr:MAG: hypothetical protein COV59_04440 [Candidatus Magasanikbacteria bacterium CG11_big_fil_rev_8_21_14_0_20_39_34]
MAEGLIVPRDCGERKTDPPRIEGHVFADLVEDWTDVQTAPREPDPPATDLLWSGSLPLHRRR